MRIGVLGPVEVRGSGEAPPIVNLGGPRPKALLCRADPRAGAGHLSRAAGRPDLADFSAARDSLAAAQYGLAAIDRDHGDLATAEQALRRCVALYALQSLAKARIRACRLDGVESMLESCREVCVAHRDRFGAALVTRTLGEAALAAGDRDRAGVLLTAAVTLWRELGLPLWEARTLRDLAAATGSSEQWAAAIRVFAATGAREQAELAGLDPRGWLERVLVADL